VPIESPAITPSAIEPLLEASFYVPATEPTIRLRRNMKRDDCFLVFDSHGDIGASPGGPDGLFNGDTRYLSHFELLINGLQPLLLGSNLSDDNCVLSVDLTNPDIYYDKRIILQKNLMHVARTVFVWRSTLFHRFVVRNFSADRVRLLLSITFDSDFADVFEVRGAQRARRGAEPNSSTSVSTARSGARLSYLSRLRPICPLRLLRASWISGRTSPFRSTVQSPATASSPSRRHS
jgi:glycogen debranching enzyme